MLRLARQMGFTTFGFALTPEAAYTFAKSRADALILNVGLTFEIADTIETKNHLQLSITRAREMLAAVHHSGRKPVCRLYGGSVTKPENFDRSEERRVGKECGLTCRNRWGQVH